MSARKLVINYEKSSKETGQQQIGMLVSSRHVMLAPPVLKAMFQRDNFKAGRTLLALGTAQVPLPDDASTFRLLLNIIHGRTRSISKR